MNKTDDYSNVDERYEGTRLPNKLATLKEDLQSLSSDELCTWLDRWRAILLENTKQTSLMLTVFLEVSQKVNGSNPIRDNLSFLDFLAQLKQEFFSCDIFAYGESLYDEYMEGIYRAAGSYSYYLKPAILQKYAQNELEKYEQVRMILEEHHSGSMMEWLEIDTEKRISYLPSVEEICYLAEHAQTFIKEDGNVDKALFFLYRAVLLSLKRFLTSNLPEAMEEKERLLEKLLDIAITYQLASDEKHALEVLEYAQRLAEQEPNSRKDNITECVSDTYEDIKWRILRRKGYVQNNLYIKKKEATKEDVLSSYQEALTFSESIYGKDSTQAEEIRKDIAWFRANSGEQGEMAVLFEQLKKAEEENDSDTLESLHGIISEIYEDAGDFENAILHYQIKMNIIINEYGEDSDVAADYYNMFGELYEKAGKYSDARDCYEHALANYQAYLLRTQEEDADDPETTLMNYEECLYHMGRMHLVAGEYEKAILYFQEALDIFDSRCEYFSGERADYLKALAETYEKMSFMGKACHYYLWAWDTYQAVAEFNGIREKNVSLFEEETEECVKKGEQIRLHMKEIGLDRMLLPIEEINYSTLNKEEQEYFLERFGQLVRRRLKNQDIWKNWIFLWKVYHRLWTEWQQKTEAMAPFVLERAFSMLQRYLKKDADEKVIMEFSKKFFIYLSEDEYEDEGEDEEDWEENWDEDLEKEYLAFYYALGDFFHAILESETDYNSFQMLICSRLPVRAEMFTSAYSNEDGYTTYEQKLRYRQAVSSSVFIRWITDIQKDIRLVLSSQTEEELWG